MIEVVVVGGGASPLNQGWGERVDAAPIVVRMFDHGWQCEHPEDYGERCDVSFSLVNPTALERWPGAWTPAEFWLALTVPRFKDLWERFRIVPVRLFDLTDYPRRSAELTKDAPARPTLARGVAAALTALVQLEFDRLRLVGFDHLEQGVMMPSAHKPMDPYRQGRRSVDRYDPVADRRLLETVALENEVSVHFNWESTVA